MIRRILLFISTQHFWPRMHLDVEECVATCHQFEWLNVVGLLHPLDIPNEKVYIHGFYHMFTTQTLLE